MYGWSVTSMQFKKRLAAHFTMLYMCMHLPAVPAATDPVTINLNELEDGYYKINVSSKGTMLESAHKLNYFVKTQRESPDIFVLEEDDEADGEMRERRSLLGAAESTLRTTSATGTGRNHSTE
jgi:hypothetical protein